MSKQPKTNTDVDLLSCYEKLRTSILRWGIVTGHEIMELNIKYEFNFKNILTPL